MQSIDSMIEVLQAYKDGKKIEWNDDTCHGWMDFPTDNSGYWNFYDFEYRVKKEPLVKWAAIDKYGLVVAMDGRKAIIEKWIDNQQATHTLVKFVEEDTTERDSAEGAKRL